MQQSGIQAIEVLGDPSDLKHRRRASQSADAVQKSSASEGASAAFRSLLNKVSFAPLLLNLKPLISGDYALWDAMC